MMAYTIVKGGRGCGKTYFMEAYNAGLRDGYQQALDDIKRRLLELSNIKSPENREKEGNK